MATGEKRIADRLKWIGNTPGMIEGGTSTVPLEIKTHENIPVKLYFTSASADASHSVESIYLKTTMTVAAGVGGRARFHLYTNVKLGGWCNALKGYSEFGSAGGVTGLASAVCAEISMPNAAQSGGTFAPLESELIMNTSSNCAAGTALLYMAVSGAGIAAFKADGYLFILDGPTDTANGMFDASAVSGVDSTHALRIRINGTPYFIPIHTSVGFA